LVSRGRLSHQYSDGYIDRAWSNLNSTYLSGGYYGKNTIVKGLFMAGIEKHIKRGVAYQKNI